MDVAARTFEFGERLLRPIPTPPTRRQVRVGTLRNGRPSNHNNTEQYSLIERSHLSGDVVYRYDDLFYKSMPKGDMELTPEYIFHTGSTNRHSGQNGDPRATLHAS